nr:glycerophosphodiester phosphodiesterase family protein [uncultured Draconibacterium sp.]
MKKSYIFGLLFIGMILSIITMIKTPTIDLNDKSIVIIGHRGAAALAPENTLASIQKAIDVGVDIVEIDVQRTSDNVIIVLHDKSIDRTTNGSGKTIDLTYEQILSKNIVDKEGNVTNYFIPTLEEVLKLVQGQSKLLIEIKNGSELYPGIEHEIVNIVNKFNAKSWCIIQSFEDDILEKVHEIDPDFILHKLFYGNFLGFGLKRKDLSQYSHISSFNSFNLLTSKRFVNKIHKEGKTVFVWTVNKEKKMKKAINKNIDGIISDNPGLMKDLLESKK